MHRASLPLGRVWKRAQRSPGPHLNLHRCCSTRNIEISRSATQMLGMRYSATGLGLTHTPLEERLKLALKVKKKIGLFTNIII